MAEFWIGAGGAGFANFHRPVKLPTRPAKGQGNDHDKDRLIGLQGGQTRNPGSANAKHQNHKRTSTAKRGANGSQQFAGQGKRM